MAEVLTTVGLGSSWSGKLAMPRRDKSLWKTLNVKPNLLPRSCSWRQSCRNVVIAGMKSCSQHEYVREMKYVLKTFSGAISPEPS